MLEQLSAVLVQLVSQFGYLGVFIASMAESFFIPIPAEIIAFTAGYYAKASGDFTVFIVMVIVCTAGNFVGAAAFYSACRKGAETFLPRFINRWGPFLMITQEELDKAENLFHKHGKKMVFISKFLPVIKNLIDFPAGISKMPFSQYSLYTIAGSFIRNLIYTAIGYFVYESKDQIFAIFNPVEKFILLLLAVGVIVYVMRVVFRIRELSLQHKTPQELQRAENDI